MAKTSLGGILQNIVKASENVEKAKKAGKPITVWHGSPHKFKQFDFSQIGTGEGAQAYGHGGYFAERRGIAEEYKKNLSDNVFIDSKGNPIRPKLAWDAIDDSGNFDVSAYVTSYAGGKKITKATRKKAKKSLDKEIGRIQKSIDDNYPKAPEKLKAKFAKKDTDKLQQLEGFKDAIDSADLSDIEFKGGYLYKAEFDATPDELLDWDKPFSEQSEFIKNALGYKSASQRDKGRTGRQLYYNIAPDATNQAEATDALSALGIKGIQYDDAMSRGGRQQRKATIGGKPARDYDPYVDFPNQGYELDNILQKLEGGDDPAQLAQMVRESGDYSPEAVQAFESLDIDIPKGTKNYVAFDDSLISIAERNGIPMSQIEEVARAKGISNEAALKSILTGMGLTTAAAMVPQEAEASFIGRMAKSFKMEALNKAEQMTEAGANRDEIWRVTGEMGAPTFKDADGHWKQEISDEGLKLLQKRKGGLAPYKDEKLEDYLSSPVLGEYDYAKGIVKEDPGSGGSYVRAKHIGLSVGDDVITPDYDFDEIGIGRRQYDAEKREVAGHELQHSIQQREGFALGGAPVPKSKLLGRNTAKINNLQTRAGAFEEFITGQLPKDHPHWEKLKGMKDKIDVLLKERKDIEENYDPQKVYERIAGEAEARNVETRLDYPMEQRIEKPPWTTLDVPEEELTYTDMNGVPMLKSGGAEAGVGKLAMDAASRMARAKEQGFDVDTPYYRGTTQDEEIGGQFLTKDPDYAARYAQNNPANKYSPYATGGNVAQRFLKGEPFDITKDKELFKEFEGYVRDTGIAGQGTDPVLIGPEGGLSFLAANSAKEFLDAKGINVNHLLIDELNGNMGVRNYEPTAQRSVNAAHDPAKKDSSNLLASTAGVGVGTAAAVSALTAASALTPQQAEAAVIPDAIRAAGKVAEDMSTAARMARAKEQGFEEDVYYKGMYPYTGGDVRDWSGKIKYSEPEKLITEINRPTEHPAFNQGEKGVDIAGFLTKDKDVANRFSGALGSTGGAVYPLRYKKGKTFTINADGAKAGDVQFGESGKEFREAIRSGEFDTVEILNTIDEGDVTVALKPSSIRSKHAAFGTAAAGVSADLSADEGQEEAPQQTDTRSGFPQGAKWFDKRAASPPTPRKQQRQREAAAGRAQQQRLHPTWQDQAMGSLGTAGTMVAGMGQGLVEDFASGMAAAGSMINPFVDYDPYQRLDLGDPWVSEHPTSQEQMKSMGETIAPYLDPAEKIRQARADAMAEQYGAGAGAARLSVGELPLLGDIDFGGNVMEAMYNERYPEGMFSTVDQYPELYPQYAEQPQLSQHDINQQRIEKLKQEIAGYDQSYKVRVDDEGQRVGYY